MFFTPERGDSYGYEYSEGNSETYDRNQLTSYAEAFSVGQEALRSGQAVSMHARERHYPRNYDSEGYAPDSTDSTEVGMNGYDREVRIMCCYYSTAKFYCFHVFVYVIFYSTS